MPPIVLLTDFGWSDSYVGQVKGAILSVHARAQMLDLTHDIPPYGIEAAGYILGYTYPVFPKGSVFVCVVDPGVGTKRGCIAVKADGRYFVGPDNGLLSVVCWRSSSYEIRTLTEKKFWRKEVSSTFHGRDIFGPVGAYLSRRPSLFSRLGPLRKSFTAMPGGLPEVKDGAATGRIIHIDRFGNLLTNIESQGIPAHAEIQWKGRYINGVTPTYGAAPAGTVFAVRSSFGLLELAMREQSCAKFTGAQSGDKVRVRWKALLK